MKFLVKVQSGFLSPLLVTPKMLFQQLCSGSHSWDSSIPANVLAMWREWFKQALKFKISLSRSVFCSDSSVLDMQLHGFSDASVEAYACVIYLRVVYSTKRIDTSLIMSKSRITPKTKPQTIPRLELLAAMLLSRLMKVVTKVILHWIYDEHKI